LIYSFLKSGIDNFFCVITPQVLIGLIILCEAVISLDFYFMKTANRI